jgi:hypothetical protein
MQTSDTKATPLQVSILEKWFCHNTSDYYFYTEKHCVQMSYWAIEKDGICRVVGREIAISLTYTCFWTIINGEL